MQDTLERYAQLSGPIADWGRKPGAMIGPEGIEPPLSETLAALRENVRAFASRSMRPAGRALDAMSDPQETISADSPFWAMYRDFSALGITPSAIGELPEHEQALAFSLVFEELGWGDAGLAVSIGAGMLPSYIAVKCGRTDLLEKYPEGTLGCWGITEPDHGTDNLDTARELFRPDGTFGRSNCTAQIKGGKVYISGQKSAWVSNGPVADVCILNCLVDTRNGPDPARGVCVLVPMDTKGVSRGKVVDKIGQRPLPQGEIFFDNVEVDIENVIAGPEDYPKLVYLIHAEANGLMGAIFAGAARAAYDLAHAYAHERKQGGVPIIRHQNVAARLFEMARRTEAATALSRKVLSYNLPAAVPALQAAMMAKVTSTQTAFDVSSAAVQMFGGNGMTREYPVEKMLRDARVAMIEDGCNEVLAIKGGYALIDDTLI